MRMVKNPKRLSVTRSLWILAACLAASPAWSGPGIRQSSVRGNQYFATVHLSGGDIGAELTLTFEDSAGLDSTSLDVSAELVDPRDPQLAARLPTGLFIPARFPVLMCIAPNAAGSPVTSGVAFSLELRTNNLSFTANTPLRLLKAPAGGAFPDVTETLGVGSLRLGASGGRFSEFLIAADLRPHNGVIEGKFQRFQDLVTTHAGDGAIDPDVAGALQNAVQSVREAFMADDAPGALAGGRSLLDAVGDGSRQMSVARELRSALRSLQFSLLLGARPAPLETGGVTREMTLPGGPSLALRLSFAQAFTVDPEDLDIQAELIDPQDSGLRARLPAGVHVPEEFPVLIRIKPRNDPGQAFRGRLSLEVETDDIDFLGGRHYASSRLRAALGPSRTSAKAWARAAFGSAAVPRASPSS